MDETYAKVNGHDRYLYRAVDKAGDTVDFLLTARRDRDAARRFLEKATRHNGVPTLVNIDKSGANKAGIEDFNGAHDGPTVEVRQCKYLNNIVEQDHRNIKRRIRPMLGFKSFWTARVVLGGIELVHMLRKGQLASATADAANSCIPGSPSFATRDTELLRLASGYCSEKGSNPIKSNETRARNEGKPSYGKQHFALTEVRVILASVLQPLAIRPAHPRRVRPQASVGLAMRSAFPVVAMHRNYVRAISQPSVESNGLND